MKKRYLLTPGPTPIPPEALLAMGQPIIHHRTEEYRKLFAQVTEDLKYIFQTKNDLLTFTSSGTGAMEAAVSNLLSKGDKTLVVRGGKFGERFGEICDSYGVEVLPIDVDWGMAVEPKLIEERLKDNPEIKAVFTTLCETSTGVVNDIEAISKMVSKSEAVLVIDAISGLGAVELKTDEWGVDVVVAGSQKGLMIPPGLSFVSVSDKAWEMVERSNLPKYYFSFKMAKEALEKKRENPFTPAISLVVALKEALELIKEEGLEQTLKRHARLAEATRAAVKAIGLELFAPKSPANALTAVKVPQGVDGTVLVKVLAKDYGVIVAGGQAKLKGKIFRIAHLGYIDRFDLTTAISALEMALKGLGVKLELVSGVRAAVEVLSR